LVRAERIRGSIDVDNQNGSVTVNDVDGNATVTTSFSPVFLEKVDGTIDVRNQNGTISVSGVRQPCRDISLRTSFAPIKLALPSGGRYNLSARTSFGRISTDLPVTTTSVSDESLTGTINGGGCRLELVTANGNVTI